MVVPSEEVKAEVSELISEHKQNHLRINANIPYTPITLQISHSYDFKENELQADVIVARGILAAEITRLVSDTPVVEVPVTTGDILSALTRLDIDGHSGSIAVIGLGPVQHQLKLISEQFHQTFSMSDCSKQLATKKQIEELFYEALEKGCTQFLGGALVTKLAKEHGFNSSFVNSCSESVLIALTQAQHIAATRRKECERRERFNELLNHSSEGIITLDANLQVIQINHCAADILCVDSASIIGRKIEALIDNTAILKALSKSENTSELLIKLFGDQLVFNVITASLYQEPIGAIITFRKLSQVQSAEINIRNKLYHKQFRANYCFDDLIGDSAVFQSVISKAKIFANAPSSVLILGESGTGKELFAQSIHNASERSNAPFVAVNCAAIPDNLIESEFFGYKSGAFTGASRHGKAGLFEIAHKGTIFLDEVSELPLHLQSKLLRVVQEGEIMRLGSDRITPVDVRIICAANKDLRPMVKENRFRADLYYRLAVLQLFIPKLSLRGADVILLFHHFTQRFAEYTSIEPPKLLASAEQALLDYPWEGNVRELSNICEQLVVLHGNALLNEVVINNLLYGEDNMVQKAYFGLESKQSQQSQLSDKQLLERERILVALKRNQFNRSAAAKDLGIDRTTLWRKMKQLNVSVV